MKITIDTENLTEKDKDILQYAFPDLFMKEEKIEQKEAKFEYPKFKNSLNSSILHCLQKHDRVMTLAELNEKIENKMSSIQQALFHLHKQKKVGKTDTLPRGYFIHGNNPEFREFAKLNPKIKMRDL